MNSNNYFNNIDNSETIYKEINGVGLTMFKRLLDFSHKVVHAYTTRIGGVSEGCYSTLNMSFKKEDDCLNVFENYKRVANALNLDINTFVLSDQIHDNKIKVVTKEDMGKGITKTSDIIGFDGLVTNCKGVTLVTYYADCVPVFFYDTKKSVIGLAHSGWKGTYKNISLEMLEKMKNEYNCNYKDIIICIGPHIRGCCFEVGRDLYDAFISQSELNKSFFKEAPDCEKWFLNLEEIIVTSLIKEGIDKDNIISSCVCTKCNNDLFFSHRGSNGKTGLSAAILHLM